MTTDKLRALLEQERQRGGSMSTRKLKDAADSMLAILGQVTRESRTRQKLRKGIEALGFKIKSIEWEPIGMMVENIGRLGGWLVVTECGEHLTGYSHLDVIDLAKSAKEREQ